MRPFDRQSDRVWSDDALGETGSSMADSGLPCALSVLWSSSELENAGALDLKECDALGRAECVLNHLTLGSLQRGTIVAREDERTGGGWLTVAAQLGGWLTACHRWADFRLATMKNHATGVSRKTGVWLNLRLRSPTPRPSRSQGSAAKSPAAFRRATPISLAELDMSRAIRLARAYIGLPLTGLGCVEDVTVSAHPAGLPPAACRLPCGSSRAPTCR